MNFRRQGMTLVELLIVLSILAGLVSVVAVSTAGLQDRRHVTETERLGNDIADAWDRAEGLSFVSDFGGAPHSVATLQLLFRQKYPTEMTRPTPVGNKPDPGFKDVGNVKRVPGFRPLAWADGTQNVFPGTASEIEECTATGVDHAVPMKNNVKKQTVSLSGGWRGPYCKEKIAFRGDIACDGFGGAWMLEYEKDPTSKPGEFDELPLPDAAYGNLKDATRLRSFGQDRMNDRYVTSEQDWKTRDAVFALRKPQPTLTFSFTLQSGEPDKITQAHVYVYSPKADWKQWKTQDEKNMKMRLGCRHFGYTALSGNIQEHLTVGARAVFVWATDGTNEYYLPPRYLTLVPGNNELKGTLRKADQ